MYKLLQLNKYRINVLSGIINRHKHSVVLDDVMLQKDTDKSKAEFVPRKYCNFTNSHVI